jgi:hypothetical protein
MKPIGWGLQGNVVYLEQKFFLFKEVVYMASGNYAKKPLSSAPTDAGSPIPARATKRLSIVPKDPETETLTFSRDSASVRPMTTDQKETSKSRAGNTTTLPNTTRIPKSANTTALPNTTTRLPKSASTVTLPNTTKTPKTPKSVDTATLPDTTITTPKSTNTTTPPNNTTKVPKSANAATQTTKGTDTAALPTKTIKAPKNTNTTALPTKIAGAPRSTNTAAQTLTKKKAENNTVMLPEIKRGRPTLLLAESDVESITTVLPETKGENFTQVLPATTQIIRTVNIDKALTYDVPPILQTERYQPYQPWMKPWLICFIFAIISLFVLISAGIFQRANTVSLNYGGGQTYSVQVGGNQAKDWQKTNPEPIKKTIPPATGPYAVLNKPTITAAFINDVLKAHNSPAAGKGQALYDLGVQYGIDPVFALAFFQHESGFGTAGEATKTLSLGNLRCYSGATCVDQDRDGYAQYTSWEDGFKAWYSLIRNYYVNVRGLTTIDKIIPVYAPTADHNDEAAYIASLKQAITNWQAGVV